MKFHGWQKTSLIEYPGKVSTVLFTGGCNFRCPFCYNRDLVLCPDKLPATDESEVITYLTENRKLYQALVLSGGEATMCEELPGFIANVKKLGLLVGLETNGTNPGMIRDLTDKGLVDFIGMDIKAPLDFEKYASATGVRNRKLFNSVVESVSLVMGSGTDHEFRTTVIPGIHTDKDIESIIHRVKGARRFALQQFSPRDGTLDPAFSQRIPFPDDLLLGFKRRFGKEFGSFEVRNVRIDD